MVGGPEEGHREESSRKQQRHDVPEPLKQPVDDLVKHNCGLIHGDDAPVVERLTNSANLRRLWWKAVTVVRADSRFTCWITALHVVSGSRQSVTLRGRSKGQKGDDLLEVRNVRAFVYNNLSFVHDSYVTVEA